ALGRPGFTAPPTETAVRVEVSDPDYTPEKAGRLSKLEVAISKQRTVKFSYWSIKRDETRERTVDPYALLPHEGGWYVIGRDQEVDAIRTFRVSRIRGEIRFASRRERDFRLPAGFNAEVHRPPPPWQMGPTVGEARASGGAGASERPSGPVAPERFAVLQALLAYLLAACGDEPDATIPAAELVERFKIPAAELEEHLSLLNLVNFGGGCYAVYA